MMTNRGRFRISRKQKQLIVWEKLDRSTVINEREMQVFRSKLIRGLMRPVVEGRRITYSAPDGIPVLEYLGGGITVNDFFLLIAQVVEVAKKIDRNGFNINHLVLDYPYVFVNVLTKEVHFIYRPVLTQNISQSMFSFLDDLAFYAVLKPAEDRKMIDRFVDELHRMQTWQPSALEQILLALYPAVYKQIQRSKTGQSGMISDKRWSCTADQAESFESGEDTMLLEEEEDATGLLDDEKGTTLLEEETRKYPCIVRLAVYDCREVDKPVYRIGKQRGQVDYYVPNNSMVSRIHADILSEHGEYFIRDDNSTNGTFVNGSRLTKDQKKRLYDGDRFVLADEEFEFRMDQALL